MLVKYFTKN